MAFPLLFALESKYRSIYDTVIEMSTLYAHMYADGYTGYGIIQSALCLQLINCHYCAVVPMNLARDIPGKSCFQTCKL